MVGTLSNIYMERWITIKEFPNYEISNYGRCKRIKNNKILKMRRNTQGYIHYGLYNKNSKKPQSKTAHRLVLLHFGFPQTSPDHVCRHLDGDKIHNYIDNLNWGTSWDNFMDYVDQTGQTTFKNKRHL